MNEVKIHVRDDIPYVCESEMSDEDKDLFSLFMYGQTCPGFPGEGHIFYASDFERYLARKESYITKFGGVVEFSEGLIKHHGYVPYV